jgi:elongator complex protein 6
MALPALLEPYLRLPPELSLSIITSVLGASSNWLLERHIVAALKQDRFGHELDEIRNGTSQADVAVVLVSWMRDWDVWRTELRRTSVNISALHACSLSLQPLLDCSRNLKESVSDSCY